MHEEWRPVVGYEGWYAISDAGRVRRERAGVRTHVGRLLKPTQSRGYPTVSLCRGRAGSSRRHPIHRLVAAAFLGPRPAGHQVHHRDGVKTHNAVVNLEYVTAAGNVRHAVDSAAWPRGERSGNARLTAAAVAEIRASPEPNPVLAARYGVSVATISHARTGRSWGHVAGPPAVRHGVSELHSSTKLNPEAVRAIRASSEPQAVLADRYGVTQGAISLVRRRKNWAHVPD